MRPARPALVAALALIVGGVGVWVLVRRTPPVRPLRTIVLVSIDTLRRDHVGAYGGTAARTPAIDALAAAGLRFDDARTPAPLTLPAHTTMLSGLPPAVHGARTNTASRVAARSARAFRLAPEVLADAGWCTGAFVSAEPLAERYGLSAGFTRYDDGVSGPAGAPTYRRRPGAETVRAATGWLGGRPSDERVFLFVHLFDPHAPYPGAYADGVEAADRALALLRDGLARAGRADAAVLLVADHGEALGDLSEPSHGFLLGESVLRVPFVVVAPGVAPGRRGDPVDLADVAPTILALAGAPTLAPRAIPGTGVDLLAGPAPADRPRVAESLHGHHQHRWAQVVAAIVGPWKFEDRGEGRERLQRLDAPDATSSEGAPAAADPDRSAPLADVLRAYRRAEDRSPRPASAAPGGYGIGGVVPPLLEPAENARLPDPYAAITDDARLQQVAALFGRSPPPPPDVLARALDGPLATLAARHPSDPSVAFWQGRLLRALERHPEAITAFERCLAYGGPNTEAILLALRSERAAGRLDVAIARGEAARSAGIADPRVLRELSEALRAAGRGGEADAAARAAADTEAARAPRPTSGTCR